jgi:hypothetical protein
MRLAGSKEGASDEQVHRKQIAGHWLTSRYLELKRGEAQSAVAG